MVALSIAIDPTLAEMRHQRGILERRLTAGWRRIDAAVAAGQEVHEWEELWIALLGEYEQVCDTIRQYEQDESPLRQRRS